MNYITAEDYELLGFFEVEPSMLDKDTPWIYNDSVYEVIDGQKILTVAIHPAYRDVTVILKENNVKIFELEATGVKDIRVLNEKLPEILEIIVSERHSLLIKRKPYMSIYQKIDGLT